MSDTRFVDRISSYPNRRKIKIINQTPTEIIADVEMQDNPSVVGTPISASVLNQWNDDVNQAFRDASVAKTNSENAIITSNNAETKADSAVQTASEAVATANNALEKALDVETKLADRGATVYVAAQAVSSVSFDSDPQEQLNSLSANIDTNNTNINNANIQIDTKLTKDFSTFANKTSLDTSDVITLQDSSKENLKITYANIKAQIAKEIYPVGALYFSYNSTSPASLFGGSWEQVAGGRAIYGVGSVKASDSDSTNISYTVGTLNAGLPNIVGQFAMMGTDTVWLNTGAFADSDGHGGSWGAGHSNSAKNPTIDFNASNSNKIYGKSKTVQPNAYVVYIWKRVS